MSIYTPEDLKEYVIYKITNLVNMKCYIGRTCDFERRMREHQKINNTYISNAIQKHGWDNFTTEILEYCLGDKQTAEREKYNIWLYESFGPLGYNLTTGGENYIVSEEKRLNHSICMTGENNPMYGKFDKDHPATGTKRTEEQLLKVSGEKHWMFGLAKEEHHCYGRKHNEEQTLNQSKRQRKQFLITYPDGHQEIIDNLPQFCKDYNLIYSSMACVAQGKMKFHRGFKCEHYISVNNT